MILYLRNNYAIIRHTVWDMSSISNHLDLDVNHYLYSCSLPLNIF
uniref:Uncharacterized protein n=1 Tax=Anguilla anguilla TaxID=7936 RepID=A0A0E9WUV9_ANGAN